MDNLIEYSKSNWILILKEIDDVLSEKLYDNLFVERDVNNDIPDKNNINNQKSFFNNNNSCSFDCFIYNIHIFYTTIIRKLKNHQKI